MSQKKEFTVNRKGEEITFTSTLTDKGAQDACAEMSGKFPNKLANVRNLTDAQRSWVHFLATQPQPELPDPVKIGDPAAIIAAIAKKNDRFPAVLIDDRRYSVCGDRSKYTGDVSVKVAKEYAGRIDTDGTFYPFHGFETTATMLRSLKSDMKRTFGKASKAKASKAKASKAKTAKPDLSDSGPGADMIAKVTARVLAALNAA